LKHVPNAAAAAGKQDGSAQAIAAADLVYFKKQLLLNEAQG